jgi:DnaK suppressor protein
MGTIRRDLERKRSALADAISSSIDWSRDADRRREIFKDPYGSASQTHDDEVTAAVVDRRARELGEVERALEDIAAGRYGICRDCGRPIPAARLRVLPFATRCLPCQANTEALGRAA